MNTFLDARIKNLVATVLVVLSLFLLVGTIGLIADIKYKKSTAMPSNIISARGIGEAIATPDIATFSFTVREKAPKVEDAKNAMSEKANKAIAFLKEKGIEEKDIKTEAYYSSPSYAPSVCGPYSCPPSKVDGYEVSETISVKVRDVAKAGDLLSGIANFSITEVSGISFTVDDMETLRAEAKADAIAKARADAEATAKNLGVRLGRVTSFYEDGPYQPYYDYGMGGDMAVKAEARNAAPSIQPGEEKVTSTVSITFEIK